MRIPKKEFIYIYERVPRFCVEVLVQTNDGILITKRGIAPFKGYWHFAGGTVYIKETIKKAVKRIAKEELNLNVEIIKNIGLMEFHYNNRGEGHKHVISNAFLVKAKDINNLKLNEQGTEVMFCKTEDDVPKHIIKEHATLLKDFLKEKISLHR